MVFREVSVVEIREVLRAWLDGAGLRTVGERAGVDRKTARRYVQAVEAAGLVRDAGAGATTDELVGSETKAGFHGFKCEQEFAFEALVDEHLGASAGVTFNEGDAIASRWVKTIVQSPATAALVEPSGRRDECAPNCTVCQPDLTKMTGSSATPLARISDAGQSDVPSPRVR